MLNRKSLALLFLAICSSLFTATPAAQQPAPFNVKERYAKSEHDIPMRDGKKLHTVVYAPRDSAEKYPMLMQRTPYGSNPYGDAYRSSLGPSPAFMQEGYIFVYQDVRGTFLSEGEFDDVRPFNPNKKSNNDIDEASDTYDTIEKLINLHITFTPLNNSRPYS